MRNRRVEMKRLEAETYFERLHYPNLPKLFYEPTRRGLNVE